MVELAKTKTKAALIKNKFSVGNIEETMSDLLGTLNQTVEGVSDFSDSSDDSPAPSPTHDASSGTAEIAGIQIVIEDASGNTD